MNLSWFEFVPHEPGRKWTEFSLLHHMLCSYQLLRYSIKITSICLYVPDVHATRILQVVYEGP